MMVDNSGASYPVLGANPHLQYPGGPAVAGGSTSFPFQLQQQQQPQGQVYSTGGGDFSSTAALGGFPGSSTTTNAFGYNNNMASSPLVGGHAATTTNAFSSGINGLQQRMGEVPNQIQQQYHQQSPLARGGPAFTSQVSGFGHRPMSIVPTGSSSFSTPQVYSPSQQQQHLQQQQLQQQHQQLNNMQQQFPQYQQQMRAGMNDVSQRMNAASAGGGNILSRGGGEEDYPNAWALSTRLDSEQKPRMKKKRGGPCGSLNSFCCNACDSQAPCGQLCNCKGCCDREMPNAPHAISKPVIKEHRRSPKSNRACQN